MSGSPRLLSMLDITELFSFHTVSGHFYEVQTADRSLSEFM